MQRRILVLAICLLTLLIELVMDPSTNFVRIAPPETIGRLVIQTTEPGAPASSETPADGVQLEWLQVPGGAHAAIPLETSTFSAFIAIKSWIPASTPIPLPPPLSGLYRPPIC